MEEKTPPLKLLIRASLQLVESKKVSPVELVTCLCFLLVILSMNHSISIQTIKIEIEKIKEKLFVK